MFNLISAGLHAGDGYVFCGRAAPSRQLGECHSLPVILVLHNPADGMTLWQRVERHLVTETAERFVVDDHPEMADAGIKFRPLDP